MNIKDYIESGMLELYAAGALSSKERSEVEALLAQHPELRKELNAIEQALEIYATAHARTPSDRVLKNLMTSIEDHDSTQHTSAKEIEFRPNIKRTSQAQRYLAIAASILLFLSVAVNVYFYSKYQGVQDEIAQMREQNLMMANQNDVMQANFNKLKNDMDVIKSPLYVAITMKGQPVSPEAIAVVYWDKTNGKVYISANNLPSPDAGKQYQLWALKDGKPVDAGVFDMNGEMQLMKTISDADAFAVTLEPMGGMPAPSGNIYVLGNV